MAARPEPLPEPGVGFALGWGWKKATLVFLGVCPLQEGAVRGASARDVLWNGPSWSWGCLAAWGMAWGTSSTSVLGCQDLCLHVAPCWGVGWAALRPSLEQLASRGQQ